MSESDNTAVLHQHRVHHVLAHSYFFYFGAFLVGLFMDFLFPLKIFNVSEIVIWGFLALIIGTFLIFWAQRASRTFKAKKKEGIRKEIFFCGPYKYTRAPTHFGLLLLIIGFGIMVNAFFIVVS